MRSKSFGGRILPEWARTHQEALQQVERALEAGVGHCRDRARCLPEFLVFASQVVLDESAAGDPLMAGKRMELLRDVPLLEITPEVAELAAALIARLPLPSRAGADAAHIAVAAYHRMNFLLTWNCKHIANAVLRPRIEKICREQGYSAPVLCTPEELIGDAEDDQVSR